MNMIKSALLMIAISLSACAVQESPSAERPGAQQATSQELSTGPTCVPSSQCTSNQCWCDCGTLCNTVHPFCASPVIFEGSTTAEDHCFDACSNRC